MPDFSWDWSFGSAGSQANRGGGDSFPDEILWEDDTMILWEDDNFTQWG